MTQGKTNTKRLMTSEIYASKNMHRWLYWYLLLKID